MDQTISLPDELTNLEQWVASNRQTKMPFSIPRSDYREHSKPENWVSFIDADEFISRRPEFGLAFYFQPENPFYCIDLDDARNPQTGDVEAWAAEIIQRFDTYTEVSKSGSGFHLICGGKAERIMPQIISDESKHSDHKPQWEVKVSGPCMLTGHLLPTSENTIRDCSREFDWLISKIKKTVTPKPVSVPQQNGYSNNGAWSRVVDDFNRQGSISEELAKHGWQILSATELKRPGKTDNGVSATIGPRDDGTEAVAFWTTDCFPFQQSHSGERATTYDRFSVVALLDCGGDRKRLYQEQKNDVWASIPSTNHTSNVEEIDELGPASVWRKFPVEKLPCEIGDYAKQVAKNCSCDVVTPAMGLLAAISCAIGNSRAVQINNDWIESGCLWLCVVGDSGSSKSPPLRQTVTRFLTDRDTRLRNESRVAREDYKVALDDYKHAISMWRKKQEGPRPEKPVEPAAKAMILSTPTVEAVGKLLKHNPRGIMLFSQELSAWIGSFDQYRKGSDQDCWIGIYDSDPISADRADEERSISVERPYCPLIGGIQTDRLFSTFGGKYESSGLTARILFAKPPVKRKKVTTRSINGVTRFAVQTTIDNLFDLTGQIDEGTYKPIRLDIDDEAFALFESFNDRNQEQIQFDLGTATASALSKHLAVAARLSLIFELCEKPNATVVSCRSMESAIAITEWFSAELIRIKSLQTEDREERRERMLINILENRDLAMSAYDVKRAKRELRKLATDEVEKVLHSLVRKNTLEKETIQTGGKPKTIYRLRCDK